MFQNWYQLVKDHSDAVCPKCGEKLSGKDIEDLKIDTDLFLGRYHQKCTCGKDTYYDLEEKFM